jgi:2-amino-4-hydroxy-6-hydroxymethyldihydropteridine diphosphokinase
MRCSNPQAKSAVALGKNHNMTAVESVTAFIGLGSNLNSPEKQVRDAIAEIASMPQTCLLKQSKHYQTKPWGVTDQPDFINAVVMIETRLGPYALLEHCQQIESAHHRVREQRWGPRTLDCDILIYGDLVLDDPRLTLPHPRYQERDFVMAPLREIAPEFVSY